MSRYSGKYDFCDFCESSDIDHIINNCNIFLCDQIVPLKFESKKDLIPYYPHIIGVMASDENGRYLILSSESYVDEEEKEVLEARLGYAKRYWRKCKRKKVPFDVDECAKEISFVIDPEETDYEIARRVSEFGEKANIDNIHIHLFDYMRQQLYESMIAEGWNEIKARKWCFGVNR